MQIQHPLLKFNKLAYDLKFVYSLYDKTLDEALMGKFASQPINVIITYNTLLKLKELNKIYLQIKNQQDPLICLPFINIEGIDIYLNVLIPSKSKNNNVKIIQYLKKANQGKKDYLTKLFDLLFSSEPDIWSFVYFDYKEMQLKLKYLSNININYYKVVTLSGVQFPYIEIK
ncbi:hypothetical protein BCF59_0181 [Mycoplasmopsis mustelae]|uniref:Uncharacterized protein n=1 Tax=Mycoplasmopsis mustelae TaxID=171289 RepID=A0A4R7UCV4_9BACT|nr:hypothetical protein [Mycoplasmopsis mustelae]TDV24229.1 hypothetical protein BCF59_0181 [Mycoplasmopsis mustelae]